MKRSSGEVAVDGDGDGDLEIRLLGAGVVRRDGHPVDALSAPRLLALVARLALATGDPVDRSTLAYGLWPDSTDAQARTNLRHLLHTLRNALEDHERWIEITPRTTAWIGGPEPIDLARFLAADAAGDAATAAAWYGGDLLPGQWDEWVLEERERLRRRAASVMTSTAQQAEEAGDVELGLHWSDRVLEIEPGHEPTYRRIMRLHVLAGDRVRGLNAYHACVTRLAEDLDMPPDPETRELYESIRASSVTVEAEPPAIDLVGRDDEFALLEQTWQSTVAGRRAVAVVSGEAGIGKSHLVETLADRCESGGGAVLRSRAYETDARRSLGPVVDWLRSPQMAETIAALEGPWRTELSRVLPELRESPLGNVPPVGDAQHQRAVLHDTVVEVLSRAPQPALLVLDDLQWCDPGTVDLLNRLVRRRHDDSLLVVLTIRSGEVDDTHPASLLIDTLRRDGLLTELALEPLDEEHTLLLAEHATGGSLDPTLTGRLWRETEGNPLFVVEAVRAGAAQSSMLTPTVRGVIRRRLGQLDDQTRGLLEYAATIGRQFTVDVLARASGRSEENVVDSLDELWRRRIVRDHGDHFDFGHDRVREVAAESVSPVRKRRLHRTIADAIETIHLDDLGPVAADLAEHNLAAGRPLKAVESLRRAAGEAMEVFAVDDAISALREALALLEHLPPSEARQRLELDLRVEIGAPLVALGGYGHPSVTDDYERARRLAGRLGVPTPAPVLRGLSISAVVDSRFDRADELGDQLLSHGEEVATVEGHYVKGVVAFWVGDLDAAVSQLEAAIERYDAKRGDEHRSLFSQDPRAICLARLALARFYQGRGLQARQLMSEAVAFADELDHPPTTAYVRAYELWQAVELGDPVHVAAAMDGSGPVWESGGFFRDFGHLLQAWLAARESRDAADLLRVADLWRREGRNLHLTFALSLAARECITLGDAEAGRLAVDDGLTWTTDHRQRYLEPEFLRLDALLHELAGDGAAAVDSRRRGAALAGRQGADGLLLRILTDAADSPDSGHAVADLATLVDRLSRVHCGSDLERAIAR